MLKYKYGKTTIERLKGVDPKLIILVATYMSIGKKDIGVTYGIRTSAEQEAILKKGNSQVKKSKHQMDKEIITTQEGGKVEIQLSNAIDILGYDNGKARWDRAFYEDIIEDMKEIVSFFGWTDINFGWDFKSLNDPYHISVSKIGDGGVK